MTPHVQPGMTHVYHQYTIRVNRRDEFAEHLKLRGVGTGIYYPVPVHRQKPFVALGYGEQRFPVAEQLSRDVLSIPVHPSLTDEEVETVIAAVNGVAAELGPIAGRDSRMSDPSRPLRAAVIGLGMMGRAHVRVWDELVEGVELVAVADTDPAALRECTDGRAARGYTDAASMLAAEDLDLVSVVVPTSLHLPTTIAALDAGSNVLVEKPIAATRGEAEKMIDAARRAGRMLTVGHIERFNPAIRELRRRLAAGELGRIFEIRATRLGPFPARIRDVGVVVDLAPHDLDVMRYLLGSDPVRLYAETEQRIHTDHEDLFVGLLKFANGAVGVLDINWLTPTKQRTLSVTGERGMYTADYLAQQLIFYPNPSSDGSVDEGMRVEREIERREPLAIELDEFARAARDGGIPPVDPHEAMVALLLARAMVESATTGAVIAGERLASVLR